MEARFTVKEFIHRVSSPAWVVSHSYRQALSAFDCVSSSDFSRLYRRVRHLTMCSNQRLRGLYNAIHETRDVPGEVVECGSARGGSGALMGLLLERMNSPKQLWLFDSFEGLPEPTEDDPDHEIAALYAGTCRGELEQVKADFGRLGLSRRAVFVKGLFEETLPRAEVGPISMLHIDGDWYASVRSCLENLYDRVSPGGCIQIDDYGFWEGARKAVDEFLRERNIQVQMRRLDYSGRQFIKP